MTIQQTYKKNELEKRLQILRSQLYGKPKIQQVKISTNKQTHRLSEIVNRPLSNTSTHQTSDISYLRYDLLKISILTTLAIGAQLALYSALTQKLITLPYY